MEERLNTAEKTFAEIKYLIGVANNPVIDEKSRRALHNQVHRKVFEHLESFYVIISDPIFDLDEPKQLVTKPLQRTDSTEDEDYTKKPVKKVLGKKTHNYNT
jgi:hypothetical protein